MTVFHVVPTLYGALKAVDAGVDGLIVEGGEGGGFKNPRPVASMVLLPLVASKVDVPIIAAGGMVDGATMAAAFALGAEGIQMGTRMVSSAESPVHDNWKQAVVDAAETDTVFLNQHTSPALRALRTKRTDALEFDHESNAMGCSAPPWTSTSAATWRRPSRSGARWPAASTRYGRWPTSSASAQPSAWKCSPTWPKGTYRHREKTQDVGATRYGPHILWGSRGAGQMRFTRPGTPKHETKKFSKSLFPCRSRAYFLAASAASCSTSAILALAS